MKLILAIHLCLFWVMPAIAQGVSDYDPSYIPSNLQMSQFSKCGVRGGADPSWPRLHKSSVNANGTKRDEYLIKLSTEFWRKDKRLGSRFFANPLLHITVSCNALKLRPKFFRGMVDTLYAQSKKTRGERWGKLMRFDALGIGLVYYYVGTRSGGRQTDIAKAFFQHNSRSVSVFFRLGELEEKTYPGAG